MVDEPRIIVALDNMTDTQALGLLERLDPQTCRAKVGKELFTRYGPDLVRRIQEIGFTVFLDLKFHDIPNTVASACKAAADLGVWMMNVHALGGEAMLAAAQQALESYGSQKPLLIAVTILTSMSSEDLRGIGLMQSPQDCVLSLAQMVNQQGLDGVVSSAQEAQVLREQFSDMCLVTPGIRLQDNKADDQKRIMTPNAAIQAGASYLVVGRPITQADDPAAVVGQISMDIKAAAMS